MEPEGEILKNNEGNRTSQRLRGRKRVGWNKFILRIRDERGKETHLELYGKGRRNQRITYTKKL